MSFGMLALRYNNLDVTAGSPAAILDSEVIRFLKMVRLRNKEEELF